MAGRVSNSVFENSSIVVPENHLFSLKYGKNGFLLNI